MATVTAIHVAPMAYEPLIDDPEHIRAVEQQRFVVLRPGLLLREVHRHLQAQLRGRVPDLPISYPAQAHVTLAGFAAGTPLRAVQDVVDAWSRTTPPLQITVDGLACFPTPSQIVIIRIVKTPNLPTALSRLREAAGQAQLKIDTTISLQDWIFHMSVGYCQKLGGPAWDDVMRLVEELEVPDASCLVDDVEIVAFDDHLEYSGSVYRLRSAEPGG